MSNMRVIPFGWKCLVDYPDTYMIGFSRRYPSILVYSASVLSTQIALLQGMPEAWARLLTDSQISKQEQQQNPQAVLDALKYYTQGESSGQKWLQYDMSKEK